MVFNCHGLKGYSHFFIPSKTLVIFRYYWRTHLQFFSFFSFFLINLRSQFQLLSKWQITWLPSFVKVWLNQFLKWQAAHYNHKGMIGILTVQCQLLSTKKRAAAAKVRFLVNWLLLAASTRKNQLESIKLYDKWQIGRGVSTQLNSATLKRSRLKPYLSTSVLNFLLHQNYYVGIMRMYSAVDCRNFLMDYFSTS